MLISRVSSYCPEGADTLSAMPKIQFCLYEAKSFNPNAGAPYKLTDNSNSGLPNPLTVRCTGRPRYSAEPESHVYGTAALNFPEKPPKSSDRAKPSAPEF